jgi:hypothetical protein
MQASANNRFSEKRLPFLLFILFTVLLTFFEFQYHEFWKDEWQAWFVATDTQTFHQFWDLLPGEGHPILWFLILRISNGIASLVCPTLLPENLIQIVHLLLSIAAAWLFFMRFRFPAWLKLAFAMSYFIFFEYSIVNRGYVLVMLLVFATAPLLEYKGRHKYLFPLVLFLLCQTEVYGLFAAMAIATFQILRARENKIPFKDAGNLGVLIAIVAGLLLFVVSLLPADGAGAMAREGEGLLATFVSLLSGTLVIGFADATAGSGMVALLLSLLLLVAIVMVLKTNRIWLISYLFFFSCFLLFQAFVYHGGPRQWGLHFVFLLLALNFSSTDRNAPGPYYAKVFLFLLIIPTQLIHSLKIISKEKKYPFSNAIEAGRYIRQNIPPSATIIGVNKPYCTPVIGYSGHPFYSLPNRERFTYALFRERLYLPSPQEIQDFFIQQRGKEMFVVSYKPLPLDQFKNLELLNQFNRPNIREENYFLYKVQSRSVLGN